MSATAHSQTSRSPTPHDGPTAGGAALLIVDMISGWQFEDAQALLPGALGIAPHIQLLRQRCKAAGMAIIYANDNHGRWRSDFRQPLYGSTQASEEASRITQMLAPQEDDYIVLKPKHSAFFATPLQIVLRQLQADRLIVTGVTSDQCVLTTATEARMHDFEVWCPSDCIATLSEARQSRTLAHMSEVLRVRTTASADLALPPRD